MVSSVGSGSVLFSPRIAARYELELLWLGLLVCALMWIMIVEASRYTVYTGRTLLDGFRTLPGPRHWAIWVVFVPQWLACVVGVAGLGGLVGSGLQLVLPGSHVLWGCLWILGTGSLVLAGRYRLLERVSQGVALLLVALAIVTAGAVSPSLATIGSGFVPSIPDDVELPFVVPWLGTILAGSMGILWFSYWTAARGFGGPTQGVEDDDCTRGEEERDDRSGTERTECLDAWFRRLGWTAALGVVTGGIVLACFLVLGAELLAPTGAVPQGADVAADLTRLFEEEWGRAGYWLMVTSIVLALGGSIVANQDGWGRSFGDMARILLGFNDDERGAPAWFVRLQRRLAFDIASPRAQKRLWTGTLGVAAPVLVLAVFHDPVRIMSSSGIVAAAHTPFLVVTTLLLNVRVLPASARPSRGRRAAHALAGLFFLAVSVGQVHALVAG